MPTQPSSKERTITLTLSQFLEIALRQDHYCEINNIEVAEIIRLVSNGLEVCHVQMPGPGVVDFFGNTVRRPILWNFHRWRISCEAWRQAKIKSDRDRELKFILDANIKMVSKYILRMVAVTPDQANVLARMMIQKKDLGRIEAIGVKKLIERVEDIQ